MEIGRGYASFVADRDTGLGVEIATMALDSLADTGLAELISQGYIGDAAGVVNDIAADGPDYERWVEVVPTEPGALSPEQLPGRLAAVLSAPDVGAAAFSWSAPLPADDPATLLVAELLRVTVLAEHSDAAAMSAAGAVGAAAVAAEASVMVAVIHAGAVAGGLVLVVSPLGIVAVGIGAAALTHRLLTRRRR